jgi:hypothetical protein
MSANDVAGNRGLSGSMIYISAGSASGKLPMIWDLRNIRR